MNRRGIFGALFGMLSGLFGVKSSASPVSAENTISAEPRRWDVRVFLGVEDPEKPVLQLAVFDSDGREVAVNFGPDEPIGFLADLIRLSILNRHSAAEVLADYARNRSIAVP